MSATPQPAILESPPPHARFVTFALGAGADAAAALRALAAIEHDPRTVIGVGTPIADRLGRRVAGLRAFPGDLPPFPSTQHALWIFLAHGDASQLFDAGRDLAGRLRGLFDVIDEVDAFGYRAGRDSAGSSTARSIPRATPRSAPPSSTGAAPASTAAASSPSSAGCTISTPSIA